MTALCCEVGKVELELAVLLVMVCFGGVEAVVTLVLVDGEDEEPTIVGSVGGDAVFLCC